MLIPCITDYRYNVTKMEANENRVATVKTKKPAEKTLDVVNCRSYVVNCEYAIIENNITERKCVSWCDCVSVCDWLSVCSSS